MKHKSRLDLPDSRWLAYAVASAATAISGQTAEASIHYSGIINRHVPARGGREEVNLPLDQAADFVRFLHNSSFYGGKGIYWAGVGITGFASAGIAVPYSSFDFNVASKLAPGQLLSDVLSWGVVGNAYGAFDLAGRGYPGYFGRGVGYVGFFFNNGSGRQYGWARVRMFGPENKDAYHIVDYAYGDVGDQIAVGQKSDASPMRPAEESLGALAFGAVGVVAWRKRRGAAMRD